MSAPPPYSRVPHLVAGRGTEDDRVLSAAEATALLSRPVAVEEKLDGANVVLWLEGSRIECALRSGPGSADRAGQLGPLRAWMAERSDQLRALVADGMALYAEWLYLTHSVAYDRLPAYLVTLDLRSPDGTFATVDDRNERCAARGMATPAKLYRGVVEKVDALEPLLAQSRYASGPAEGVIVRALDGAEPRLAKLLNAGFRRLGDDEWAGGRPRNLLADRERSWR
ncbi:MAG: RNA ligase family protein [Acidimicrobiales bacterium]